jgi:hypothetical protein
MDINDLTLGQAKELAALFGAKCEAAKIDNGMLGKYVIVRCRDAGVHAGVLKAYNGRECLLTESRRLWYWKAANDSAFLSGVATEGITKDSKVGAPLTVHITENCEIIACTEKAEKSIRAKENHSV